MVMEGVHALRPVDRSHRHTCRLAGNAPATACSHCHPRCMRAHLELAVGPLEGLTGGGGLGGAQGRAVHIVGVGLVGGAVANQGGHLDQGGLVGHILRQQGVGCASDDVPGQQRKASGAAERLLFLQPSCHGQAGPTPAQHSAAQHPQRTLAFWMAAARPSRSWLPSCTCCTCQPMAS